VLAKRNCSTFNRHTRPDDGVVLRDDLLVDLAATNRLQEAMGVSPGKSG
jgi:hypothetical protein